MRSNIKDIDLSPFHCSCFPLVVFIFMGQPGYEGRLQGFGEKERQNSSGWGPWWGLWLCCINRWTPELLLLLDKRTPWISACGQGLWPGLLRTCMLRSLDKLEQFTLKSWLCIYLFAAWNELLITSSVGSKLLGMRMRTTRYFYFNDQFKTVLKPGRIHGATACTNVFNEVEELLPFVNGIIIHPLL